jgi:hypothetical protein
MKKKLKNIVSHCGANKGAFGGNRETKASVTRHNTMTMIAKVLIGGGSGFHYLLLLTSDAEYTFHFGMWSGGFTFRECER